MKNELKTRIKKMAAVGMAVMLTAGPMAAPVFAESPAASRGVSGEQTDVTGLTGNVTVSGIQAKDAGSVTVKAYQVVDGVYKDNKLVKYVLMDPTNAPIKAIGDQTKGQNDGHNDIITEEELTKIADNIQTGIFTADKGIALTKNTADGTYTGSLEPGMYVVLVTGATDTVYNPAVVSVNLSDANADASKDIQAGSVNLSDFFKTASGENDTNVYVKSSLSDMDKNITGSKKSVAVSEEDQKLTLTSTIDPKNVKDGKSKGDTVAYGDTVYFKLDGMTIPSFSTDYKDPVYKITDTLENNAFSAITGLSVKVNDAEAAIDTDYKITEADGKTAFTDGTSKSFQIVFTQNFLNTHKADGTRPKVEITYNATLQTTAGLNYAENLNHAEISYSNNPSDESSFKTIKKNTYHYTFGIDAALDGEASGKDTDQNQETHEFNKVTEASGEDQYDNGTGLIVKDVATKKSKHPLAGATFTIYSDEDCTKPVQRDSKNYTATSDANGHFSFVGLDEGTYYVKETTAPAKYTLSPNVYKFVITATLDEATGIMKEYSVMTSVKDTSIDRGDWKTAGSATYTNTISDTATASAKTGDGQVTNNIASTVTPMEVVDVKLQTLPSTGAAGTLGLTAAAAAGMAIFFTLSRNGKKKEEKAE